MSTKPMADEQFDATLRSFLAHEADRTVDAAPPTNAMVSRLEAITGVGARAGRHATRWRRGDARVVVLLVAALLVALVIGTALAIGSGLVRLPSNRPSEPLLLVQGARLVEGTVYPFSLGDPPVVEASVKATAHDWGVYAAASDMTYLGGGELAAILGFAHVGNLYTDPYCWQGGLMDPPIGRDPAKFAEGIRQTLATAPAVTVGVVSEATIGGVPALRVTAAYQWPGDSVGGPPGCRNPTYAYLWSLADPAATPTTRPIRREMEMLGPQFWYQMDGGPMSSAWTVDFYVLSMHDELIVVEAERAPNVLTESEALSDLKAMLDSIVWSGSS